MELLKIDKGIPIIIPTNGKEPEPHPFPFANMQVGDSFVKRCNNERNWSGYNEHYAYLYNKMYAYVNEVNKTLHPDKRVKFAIRKVLGGFRCWRVK